MLGGGLAITLRANAVQYAMRRLMIVLLLAATAARADVVFVAPQAGAQAIGRQIIEISTTTADVNRVEFYVDGVLAGVARTAPYRVEHDFGTSVGARTIEARVFSGGYATTERAQITTVPLTAGESIDIDLVEVPVRIRSRRTVTASDVRVHENGVEQRVRDVIATRPPAHFAFVVDRSLSMSGGRLEAALRAIDAARSHLREGDTASLVLFNHHVSRAVPLSRAATALAAAGSTAPSGGTSLRDAVASSVGQRRTYVLVITDGGDRNSQLSEQVALRRISDAKTVVSAITLGSRSPFLDRAAAATGGVTARATARDIGARLASMLEDINGRYTLVYQSSATKNGWRVIAVTPNSRGVEIASARTRYFAE